MSSIKYVKKSTFIAGLKVARNPPYTLSVLYKKILSSLQKFPPDAAYKKYTENLVKHRLQIVTEAKSVEEIENKINCGQAEELIIQAEKELTLCRKLIIFKPWESLIAEAPADQWLWPPLKSTDTS